METYNNPFQNTIFPANNQHDYPTMPTSNGQDHVAAVQEDPTLQHFTATGRPMPNSHATAKGRGMNALDATDSLGSAAPNLLPVRFTDNSVISIPVLPPQQALSAASDSSSSIGPVKYEKEKKREGNFSSFFRRKSQKSDDFDFVMKDITRADYLKYYAKDDNGRFIGTEEPARDCILKNEEDRLRYRAGLQFSHS